MPEETFEQYKERLLSDPDSVRREFEAELLAKHGPGWMEKNRRRLDNDWDRLLEMEGLKEPRPHARKGSSTRPQPKASPQVEFTARPSDSSPKAVRPGPEPDAKTSRAPVEPKPPPVSDRPVADRPYSCPFCSSHVSSASSQHVRARVKAEDNKWVTATALTGGFIAAFARGAGFQDLVTTGAAFLLGLTGGAVGAAFFGMGWGSGIPEWINETAARWTRSD